MQPEIGMRIGLSCREPLFGEALVCLLEGRRAWKVVANKATAQELAEFSVAMRPRAVIVDTRQITANELQSLVELRISHGVALLLLVDEPELSSYLDLPVDRVIGRLEPSDTLFSALDDLVRTTSPARVGRSTTLPFDLSRRELECAQLVARGMSNRRIAELTGLREQSVKNLVSLAMRKIGVENRVQIALRLTQAGVPDTIPTHAVIEVGIPVEEKQGVGVGE